MEYDEEKCEAVVVVDGPEPRASGSCMYHAYCINNNKIVQMFECYIHCSWESFCQMCWVLFRLFLSVSHDNHVPAFVGRMHKNGFRVSACRRLPLGPYKVCKLDKQTN